MVDSTEQDQSEPTSRVPVRHTEAVSAEPLPAERAYADDVLRELCRDERLSIETAEVVGSYPETELVIVF